MGRGRVVNRQRLRVPFLRSNVAEYLGLDAGDELHFARTHFVLQEAIYVKRLLRVDPVHYGQRIERHAVAMKQLYRGEDFGESGFAMFAYAVAIVQLFGTVDAQANQELIAFEER